VGHVPEKGGIGDDVLAIVRTARAELPSSHRSLLDQLGVQETAIEMWPKDVQALYSTIGEVPPRSSDLTRAVAVWLDRLRVVAFNAPLLAEATQGLTRAARVAAITAVAWHEYGHALSLARSTRDQRRDGVRLLGLLPEGLAQSIDYPGGYRPGAVFDEVIATVYAALIRRVRREGYGCPDYLHDDVIQAFKEVIPWPPSR